MSESGHIVLRSKGGMTMSDDFQMLCSLDNNK